MSESRFFHNVKDEPIPDWLQGRGVGESGGTLFVLDDPNNVRTIRPGDVVEWCDIRGFVNHGNAKKEEPNGHT